MVSLVDYKREFFMTQLGLTEATAVGKTLADLEYEFYKGVSEGSIVIGGGGGGSATSDFGFDTTAVWKAPFAQGNEAGEHDNNVLNLAPIRIQSELNLTGLSALMRNPAAATATAHIAVYRNHPTNFVPDTLVKATGSLNPVITDTFMSESFAAVTLVPDIYWVGAVIHSPGTRGTLSLAIRNLFPEWSVAHVGTGASPLANLGNDGNTYAGSGVTGAPPATIVSSPVTNSNGNNRPACIWMKLAKV